MTTRNSLRRTGPQLMLCLAVVLTVIAPGAAAANPKLMSDAQNLLAAGNPKQAYMLLVAEQNRLAGSPDFDYLLGVAALDSGKIDESIIALERVLGEAAVGLESGMIVLATAISGGPFIGLLGTVWLLRR